jgi:hypothetical protein
MSHCPATAVSAGFTNLPYSRYVAMLNVKKYAAFFSVEVSSCNIQQGASSLRSGVKGGEGRGEERRQLGPGK